MSREAAVSAMLRGLSPPPPQAMRNLVLQALETYSDRQVARFTAFGLRIWPNTAQGGSMLPPEFVGLDDAQVLRTRARYYPPMRTVFIDAMHVELGVLWHELAHAWDDAQNDRGRTLRPLDSIPAAQRRQIYQAILAQRRPVMFSQTARFLVRSGGRNRHLSLDDMLAIYRENLGRRTEFVFDLTNSYKQSLSNAQEFYAEGRTVFFSRSAPSAQARMLHFAPELFQVFEQEARRERLAVPDRNCIQQLFPPSATGGLPFCSPVTPNP